MDIRSALGQLDTLEDSHWTGDGAPMVTAVTELVGEKVSRQDIVDVAPKFSRENTELPEVEGGDQGDLDEAEVSKETETSKEVDNTLLQEYSEQDPLPEGEFVAVMNKMSKEDLKAFQELVHAQHAHAVGLMKEAQEMKARLDRAVMHIDSRVQTVFPDKTNQQAIQDYLESQRQQRASRAEARTEILKGLKLSDIDPRAAIDRAMARKSSRGAQRPARPFMNR